MDSFKKYISEFIGTACLVIFGCGALSMTDIRVASMGYFMAAAAFGLAIIAMEYTFGSVSGCHLNPAVSLAMLINRKMDVIDFIGYVIFQILGGVAGAAVLFVIYGDKSGFGSNDLTGIQGNVFKGLIVEALLTFVFVLVALAMKARDEKMKISGVVIGAAMTLVYIIGIDLTGASVNPARSIGPALLSGGEALTSLWVFIIAPLVGGALAALAFKLFSGKKTAIAAGADDEEEESDDGEEGSENDEEGSDEE